MVSFCVFVDSWLPNVCLKLKTRTAMARIPSWGQARFKQPTSDTFHPSTVPWRMQGTAASQNAAAKHLHFLFAPGLVNSPSSCLMHIQGEGWWDNSSWASEQPGTKMRLLLQCFNHLIAHGEGRIWDPILSMDHLQEGLNCSDLM